MSNINAATTANTGLTEQQAHAAIDMQASVSKFSDAVDRFDSKVPGGSAAPGNPWSLNDPGTTPRKSTR